MSGRGRKQSHRGGNPRRSQPAAGKPAGGGRTAAPGAPAQQRQQPAAEKPAGSRTGDTQPVADVRSRRPPSAGSGPRSGSGSGSGRAERYARAQRRKRNQRVGVIIGAVALGGAAIGGVIAGMAGGAETTGAGASSSPSVSPGTEAVAGPTAGETAPAAPSSVTPMAMTCPTGAGASTLFGHEIVVPEPYSVTITYGDGDEYTNDSAHLDAIFSHTYQEPGTFTVSAVLTDPTGGTATATCDYTWGP